MKKIDIEFGLKISDDLKDDRRHGLLYDDADFEIYEPLNWEQNMISRRSKEEKIQKTRTKGRNIRPALVLWDIENISFFNDFQVIAEKLRSLGIRYTHQIIGYRIRRDKQQPFWLGNYPEHRIIQLRRAGWQSEEKHDADRVLAREYHAHKERISSLVLISSDGDFAGIIDDAVKRRIRTIILSDYEPPEWAKTSGAEQYSLRIREQIKSDIGENNGY